MALSDKKILEAMEKGDIVIDPFSEKNLKTSSYDVTLGRFYFRRKKPGHERPIFNIYSKEGVKKIWGEDALVAQTAEETFGKEYRLDGIRPDDRVILLEPRETILAHTEEFIGGRNHITTMMKARSSMGRCFITVCKCAGWGDVGYVNRWTMEIENCDDYHHIPLIVGKSVAQIIFFETGPIRGGDYAASGKYQSSENLRDLKKSWHPQMMLPRLWKDREEK